MRERSVHPRQGLLFGPEGLRHALLPVGDALLQPTNWRRLDGGPHASEVRTFHGWLKAGRVVRKGQQGIKIVTPVTGGEDGGKVVTIKAAWVFDVTQTRELPQRAAWRIWRDGSVPAPSAPRHTRST